MMKRRMATIGVLAACAVLAIAGAASAVSSATVRTGEVSDRYLFNPATTTVNVGAVVTWSNGTDAPHTVTSDNGSLLHSGTIAPGATFQQTFSSTGTFAYHCTVHPYMKGTIVVLAANATPPTTDTTPAPRSGGGPTLPLIVVGSGLLGAGFVARRLRPAR